jgi:hypothetical protein
VRTRVDSELKSEAQRFGLRFTCEACAHFDPEQAVCANGYPTVAHRAIVLSRVEWLEFCKEFELV